MLYLDCIMAYFLVVSILYECALSMVTSKEYLVWVVVRDATCTLHKYDLELS